MLFPLQPVIGQNHCRDFVLFSHIYTPQFCVESASTYSTSGWKLKPRRKPFQITPIQLLTTASSFVNGGTRVTPHFGVRVQDKDGRIVKTFSYQRRDGIVSEETSETMRMLLEKVVSEGGGKKAYMEGYRIGGKTATSQTLPRGSGKYISSFLGFAPADDPQVIALAIIYKPQGVYYGGQIAAPVVKQLFENILPYLERMDYN